MKKLVLVLVISFVFIGCNSDKENVKYNKGLNFEEINKKKNKGFNFEKNNYNFKKATKDLDSNKSQLHQGCTAPCCSE